MNPTIQYVRTADGVAIAFWTFNEGPPLVYVPITPFSHIQMEWQIPECRHWYQSLAGRRQLIRYDGRGCGLSEREVSDFSLEAQLLDLEGVVEELRLDKFALFAASDGSMTAIAYAARHPERVSHLLLWSPWARRKDVSDSPEARSLKALMEQDWTIYTDTVARVLLGWSAEEAARTFAAFYRECTTAEAVRALAAAAYETDVSPLLPQLLCPTLIVYRSRIPGVGVPVVRDLAARIPNARLVLLEGSSPLPFLEDMQSVVRAIHDFLGDEPQDTAPRAAAGQAVATAPATVMFTDIQGSTAMGQRLGDKGAQGMLRVHNRIVRQALERCGGSEIKHTGDGIMASFPSATSGLECAVAIQRALAAHNAVAPDAALHVRIGLNSGEPVTEESDLFGAAVVVAARVCERAAGDQILVSNVVRELVSGKGFLFSDQGDSVRRGFEDPVRLFEVRWSPDD